MPTYGGNDPIGSKNPPLPPEEQEFPLTNLEREEGYYNIIPTQVGCLGKKGRTNPPPPQISHTAPDLQ